MNSFAAQHRCVIFSIFSVLNLYAETPRITFEALSSVSAIELLKTPPERILTALPRALLAAPSVQAPAKAFHKLEGAALVSMFPLDRPEYVVVIPATEDGKEYMNWAHEQFVYPAQILRSAESKRQNWKNPMAIIFRPTKYPTMPYLREARIRLKMLTDRLPSVAIKVKIYDTPGDLVRNSSTGVFSSNIPFSPPWIIMAYTINPSLSFDTVVLYKEYYYNETIDARIQVNIRMADWSAVY